MFLRFLLTLAAVMAFQSFVYAQAPAPTPNINVDSYIPPRPPGRTMRVASSHQPAALIQQAQDDPNTTSSHIFGGGSIQRPVVIKKYTTFDNATYSCDVEPENTILR